MVYSTETAIKEYLMKDLFIAEKPSVAAEFASALGVGGRRGSGYIEDDSYIVTWCVGHLVTMSYPEKYDPNLKRWTLQTLPFLPDDFKYEVIESVRSQFETVKKLLTRNDVGCIYICTDSGREGEYIYRLVDAMAGVGDKTRKRVWIDSQTKDEILRGIREAKDWSEYDDLAASAYLRAKEDYLMGINFSRILTLKYGNTLAGAMKKDRVVISAGRVMTCVLGMVVRREREIRDFVKIPFYRVFADLSIASGTGEEGMAPISAEWRVCETSQYLNSPKLYKENGFKERKDAEALAGDLEKALKAVLVKKEKKKETKNPPLLYNLAELQNDCSRRFRISPDETLRVVQELYEKKLVTYPRTDARVLSSAIAKEIGKNLSGLTKLGGGAGDTGSIGTFAAEVLSGDAYKKIGRTRYTNDKMITDHYAIIPTGQGLPALGSLSSLSKAVYDLICRRFLAIFYPPAIYERISLEFEVKTGEHQEHLYAGGRTLKDPGYLKVSGMSDAEGAGKSGKKGGRSSAQTEDADAGAEGQPQNEQEDTQDLGKAADILRKGSVLDISGTQIKEGETSPPKRYTSGSMILAMENAGQLIEDEELRSMIKGSGIGTSATRAEILKKLMSIEYLSLNKKTQVITPTLLGEMVYVTVDGSIRQLLNPELTASWEKGLMYVSEGSITPEEYMTKLKAFVAGRTQAVKNVNNSGMLLKSYDQVRLYYEKGRSKNNRAV